MEFTTSCPSELSAETEKAEDMPSFEIYRLKEDADGCDIFEQLITILRHAKSQASIMSVAPEAFERWNDETINDYGNGLRSLLEQAIFLSNQLWPVISQSKCKC